jgi:glycosyltransferase involved in cell wall biosynthesis
VHRPEDKIIHILHVVTRLPVGGVENMIFKVVTGYDKKKFRVTVCCLREGGEIAESLKGAGYEVIILGRMKRRGFDWGAVRRLSAIMKSGNVHILRTHQYHANLYGRVAGLIARVPVMLPSFHNLYHSPDRPKIHRRLFNYLLGLFTDRMVAVSHAVASDIVRYDHVKPEKIQVIYNGILTESFDKPISKSEARKALDLPPDACIIGNVGRLTEQKGQQFLVEAVSGMRNVAVVIAGDGPLAGKLKQQAETAGVSCIFTGALQPERIPVFLQSLDLFCFPSLWEGLGVALIEAMAAGLPIIASDLPPHREVLGEAGILVKPGDPVALRRALDALLADPVARENYAVRAKERSSLFSIRRTIHAYEELFESLLREKGRT